MPSCTLTAVSTLLTPSGWVRVGGLTTHCDALGVDRHGAFALHRAMITSLEKIDRNYFLGTRSIFGAFHADSTIIDSAGVRRTVRSIVEAESLGNWTFEKAITSVCGEVTDAAASEVWRELAAICLYESEGDALFRVLNSQRGIPAGVSWINAPALASPRHVLINRDAFGASLRADGFSVVFETVQHLRSTEEGQIEVERSNYPLLLWLLLHLTQTGMNYRLSFDSLQHTSVLDLDLQQTSSAMEPLRTAFVAGRAQTFRISWNEPGWNPISSGFVVGSG